MSPHNEEEPIYAQRFRAPAVVIPDLAPARRNVARFNLRTTLAVAGLASSMLGASRPSRGPTASRPKNRPRSPTRKTQTLLVLERSSLSAFLVNPR